MRSVTKSISRNSTGCIVWFCKSQACSSVSPPTSRLGTVTVQCRFREPRWRGQQHDHGTCSYHGPNRPWPPRPPSPARPLPYLQPWRHRSFRWPSPALKSLFPPCWPMPTFVLPHRRSAGSRCVSSCDGRSNGVVRPSLSAFCEHGMCVVFDDVLWPFDAPPLKFPMYRMLELCAITWPTYPA